MISLFFVCAVRGQIARWFVRRAKTIFADNFSAAEIILLAKNGQAKIAWSNFFRCVARADFFRVHFVGRKTQWIFWPMMGQKRGATHSPPQERFPLHVAQRCQRYKNVTLWQRVTETPRDIPTVDYDFYICFQSTISTQISDSAAS